MAQYDFKSVEKKWQDIWDKNKTFECSEDYSKPKFYGLVEFPYPSGAGMHVGHIKAYSGLEVICRKRRLEGYNVLFPIALMLTDFLRKTMQLKQVFTPVKLRI